MQFKITSLAIALSLAASSAVAAPQTDKGHGGLPRPPPHGYCNSSEYICWGTGFYTCVTREWTWNPCSPGTVCHQVGSGAYCG